MELVHRGRRCVHATSDIWNRREFEEALDGAVLSPRSVQQREHHIDRRQQLRTGDCGSGHGCDIERGAACDLRESIVDDLQVRGVRLQQPLAVGGDADRDHVVLVAIDRRHDVARGDTRNRMFVGSSPEEHRHVGLSHGTTIRPLG